MSTPREKFQGLLRELFQFDCAELDFGIYRIMNQKRAVIERFIEKDLLDGVAAELSSGAMAMESGLAQQLEEVKAKIRENFGEDAMDAEGNLVKYADSPRGQQYLELREQVGKAKSRPELEAAIFNHLYSFFSRYYDEGDFMSLRRYSKRDKYAIPYNGEEVHLHWANADQYYIKTGENFTDYSYTHSGRTVHFKLRNADVEQNNVKGAKRFFIPRSTDIAVDDDAKTLTIPLEYRPLNADEEIRYGAKKKSDNGNGKADDAAGKKKKGQEGIMVDGIAAIQSAVKSHPEALAALLHEKRKDADGNPISLLEHHLRTYVRGNSTDFFIHKDLKSFLERELDFYLKNEVLNLDELEAGGQPSSASWFQMMSAIKGIGRKIIAFVAQIENFQKRLFEKKKFITEVHYCVTLDRVPEELYPEIAKNKMQIEEWKRLFQINEIERDTTRQGYSLPVKPAFLKENSTLVLDTRFFDSEFADKLLTSKEFLKDELDGLLIDADNFQALQFLQDGYRDKVGCVHIDPPYNTNSSGFLYKNSYQHSSWLAMMYDRILLSARLLKDPGIFACHIDEYEFERLSLLLEKTAFSPAGTLVWDKGMPIAGAHGLATQHEYVVFTTKGDAVIRVHKKNIEAIKTKVMELLKKHKAPSKEAISEYRKWLKNQPSFSAGEKTYDQFDTTGEAFRSDNLSATDRRTDPKFYIPLKHPDNGKDCPVPEFGFRYTPGSLKDLIEQKLILFGEDHTTMPRKKTYLKDTTDSQMPTIYKSGSRGKNDLDDLGFEFPFAHPVDFYRHILDSTTDACDTVLDFFGGSGTTAHAVIAMNREEGTKRKYILVEMGEHFRTVLKPRIQKAIYSKEWKDGKPVSRQGSSHAFKYLSLESYEDALDNITFEASDTQTMFQLEDYVLSYMLDFETKQSETLLNVAKLDAPFDYKLKRQGKDTPLPVDLPETFNYLIGLHVASRRVYENKGVRYLIYHGKADGREAVVIWRTTRGWGKKEFEADRDFIAKQKLTDGAEDIYVNTDSFIPEAKSLDPIFKRRMFNED